MLSFGHHAGFRSSFNLSATDLKIAQLTEDMTQAFYRREHDTIDMLAAKGAKFTGEMLHASVGFRDHHLTEKCLAAGVLPTEDIVRTAVDHRDAPLVDALMRHITPTADLKKYIEDYATDAVKKITAPALQRVPVQEQDAPRR